MSSAVWPCALRPCWSSHPTPSGSATLSECWIASPIRATPKSGPPAPTCCATMDSSAARVVAAYGRPGGLSWAAARIRRRLWWRSAGPFGQLSFRIVDRIRGKRRAPHGIQPVPRTEAESEAVARVLDSVRRVAADRMPGSASSRPGSSMGGSRPCCWHMRTLPTPIARTGRVLWWRPRPRGAARTAWMRCVPWPGRWMATYGYGTALQAT